MVTKRASRWHQSFISRIRSSKWCLLIDVNSFFLSLIANHSSQTICLPVGPRCDACTLSNGLCPSAAVKKTVKTRKSVSTRAKIEIELEDEKQIYTDNVKVEAVESGKGLLASIIKTESWQVLLHLREALKLIISFLNKNPTLPRENPSSFRIITFFWCSILFQTLILY